MNVNITSQRADNPLAVPVTAMLALQGGGYGVDVVTPAGAVRLTGVTTGLYSATLVQVSGPGISAGTKAEVPSSLPRPSPSPPGRVPPPPGRGRCSSWLA